MSLAPTDRRAAAAAKLLERVFARLPVPITFRLWDGTIARAGGGGESGFAIVFRSARAFRRLIRRPTPLRFGEAFLSGELDIDGDMFAAMRVAHEVEALRVPLGTRLAVLAGSFRL
jgi:cyclopropane-fatty-acyl-phospholipid synthase